MRPFTWQQFLGLPHALAADPLEGQAADCLLLALRVMEEAGIAHPPVDPHWFALAEAHRWADIQAIFEEFTEPVAEAEPYALALITNGAAGMGVGIFIENGLLITHHKRGVVWVPQKHLKPMQFYRVKQ